MAKRREVEFRLRMPADLAAWLDGEGVRCERSRNYLIVQACERWRRRLERERARRLEATK